MHNWSSCCASIRYINKYLIKVWATKQAITTLKDEENENESNVMISLIPTINQFKTQILQMLYELENSVHDLPSISLLLFDINPGVVSFLEFIQRISQARNELSETHSSHSYRHLKPSISLEPQSYIEKFDPKGTRSLSDYRDELNKFQKVLDVVSNDMTLHTSELIMALLNQMKHFAICNLQELRDEFDQITDKMRFFSRYS